MYTGVARASCIQGIHQPVDMDPPVEHMQQQGQGEDEAEEEPFFMVPQELLLRGIELGIACIHGVAE